MSHIFISYSHQDKDYAHKLAEALEQQGFSAWIDDRIDYGTQWPHIIEEHLDGCSAFIVIMTPRSRQSTWVQNELTYALSQEKPIIPLLLEGPRPWVSVAAIQYVNVRGGRLPPPRFYDRLVQFAPRLPQPPPIPHKPPLAAQYFAKGTRAFIAGDLWEAQRYYELTLAEDPFYPRAKEELARVKKEIRLQPAPPLAALRHKVIKALRPIPLWQRVAAIIVLAGLVWTIFAFYNGGENNDNPINEVTFTFTPINTPDQPIGKLSPTRTSEPTATDTPSVTPTPTPRASPTNISVRTATLTSTSNPTPTITHTPTDPPTPTFTTPPQATSTPTATATSSSTPTATPPPTLPTGQFTLLEPDADYTTQGRTEFEWQWDGPLADNQGFEVRVWRDDEPPAGVHDAVLDNQQGEVKPLGNNTYRLVTDIKDTPGVSNREGEYNWTVALVQIKPEYKDLGIQAPPGLLRFATSGGGNNDDDDDDNGGGGGGI